MANEQTKDWRDNVARKANMSHISGTKSTSGDSELVAAPGSGVRVVVTGFVIQNESASATTMILKDGNSEHFRLLGQDQGDGLSREFSPGREWRLSDNQALNLNLSGANQCGYSVSYFTEEV